MTSTVAVVPRSPDEIQVLLDKGYAPVRQEFLRKFVEKQQATSDCSGELKTEVIDGTDASANDDVAKSDETTNIPLKPKQTGYEDMPKENPKSKKVSNRQRKRERKEERASAMCSVSSGHYILSACISSSKILHDQ